MKGYHGKRRKGISTSTIRANILRIDELPLAELYELTFFQKKDLDKLKEFLEKRGKPFGIHLPFVFRYASVHPNPTSLDRTLRNDTYTVNIKSARFAKSFGAEYVVAHFPNAKQKEAWKDVYDIVIESLEYFYELNKIIETRLENVYMNDYFHSADDYLFVLKETGCTMCLDIGHLLIDSEIYAFDPVSFIEKLQDFITEFHIYYADLKTYEECHHAPWGDSLNFRRVLEVIKGFENVDFVAEPSNDCPNLLSRLIKFLEVML